MRCTGALGQGLLIFDARSAGAYNADPGVACGISQREQARCKPFASRSYYSREQRPDGGIFATTSSRRLQDGVAQGGATRGSASRTTPRTRAARRTFGSCTSPSRSCVTPHEERPSSWRCRVNRGCQISMYCSSGERRVRDFRTNGAAHGQIYWE